MIIDNCAILVYLADNINTALSQTSIDILGTALYSLSSLGDISSVIGMSTGAENLIQGFMVTFSANIDDISALQNNFTSYDSAWQECEASFRLFDKSIPVYTILHGTSVLVHLTMIDYLKLTLDAVIDS